MGLRLLTLAIILIPPKRHTYQYALLSEMVSEGQLGQAMYLQVALNNLKKLFCCDFLQIIAKNRDKAVPFKK